MTRGEARLHLHASCAQPQQVGPRAQVRDQGNAKQIPKALGSWLGKCALLQAKFSSEDCHWDPPVHL